MVWVFGVWRGSARYGEGDGRTELQLVGAMDCSYKLNTHTNKTSSILSRVKRAIALSVCFQNG